MSTILIFIVIGLILFLGLKKLSPHVSDEHDEHTRHELKKSSPDVSDEHDEHTRRRNESSRRIIEAELEKARLYDERKKYTPKPTRKQRPPKKALNGLPLKITYEDAEGDVTVRDISVVEYDSFSQKTYAWCYARNDWRSFFTYRMLEVIDKSTGEDIKDIDSFFDEAFKPVTKKLAH